MRNLKYGVIALAPLLGAGGGFAQGLNLGMNDGLIVQAQAPEQVNGSEMREADLQPDADLAGTPVGEVIELEVPAPAAENLKTAPRAQTKTQARTQARKGEKKSKDTRTTALRTYD